MREHISDAITRRAADGITRRGSLMTLGGAGLAAIVGGSATADAKKNKKKNKQKNKEDPFELCAPQVDAVPRPPSPCWKETRRNSCVVMPSPPVKPPSSSSACSPPRSRFGKRGAPHRSNRGVDLA